MDLDNGNGKRLRSRSSDLIQAKREGKASERAALIVKIRDKLISYGQYLFRHHYIMLITSQMNCLSRLVTSMLSSGLRTVTTGAFVDGSGMLNPSTTSLRNSSSSAERTYFRYAMAANGLASMASSKRVFAHCIAL